jgi:hypothetical protein
MGLLDDEPVEMRRPMIVLEALGALLTYQKLRNQFPRAAPRKLRWDERVDWEQVLGGKPLEIYPDDCW